MAVVVDSSVVAVTSSHGVLLHASESSFAHILGECQHNKIS
jgi:hypothetical protein